MPFTPQNAVEDSAATSLRASITALFEDLGRLDRAVAVLAAAEMVRTGVGFIASTEGSQKARAFLHDAAESPALALS